MYSYEEVQTATMAYFNDNELATNVWMTKYALRDNDGNFLEKTPDDMHRRLAKEFARIEKDKFETPYTEDEIYEFFKDFKRIIPQGSVMFGCGNTYQYVTLSNCYTLESPHDSYLGINYLDTQIAQISSRRGGVGWDMSTLRPKGMHVKNAAGSTTGTVSFMHRYSNTIREVCQSGRRGASLQSLSVKHPEILDFIKCKNDDNSITGSNISVKFTDDFMKSVKNNNEFELQWPINEIPEVSEMIDANKIWNNFVDNSWERAEPGAIFIDTVHRRSTSYPYPGFEEITSNPCAEQMMPPNSCCRLICINLYNYVNDKFTNKAHFDYERFNNDVKVMQRLADDMVDLDIECMDRILKKVQNDPEPKAIKQPAIDLWKDVIRRSKLDRRTGVGIVGLADTLASLNIKYDSDKSIKTCDEIFANFKLYAFDSSVDMAKELGAFPVYDAQLDKKSEFIQDIKQEDPTLYNKMKKYGRRNMTLLTIAPTGTVSLLTNTSSGLEPVFMLEYTRRKKINPSEDDIKPDFVDQSGDKWIEFKVRHKGLQDWVDVSGETDISKSPYYKSCAHEIDYYKKVELQATIQKHIDNSISVTTNLPKDIDKETVSKLYMKAWRLGCKGFTIYRDGCRSGVLVSESDQPKTRPKELPCDVHHVSVKGQSYFILIGIMDNAPYEVFAGKNNVIKNSVKYGTIIRKRKGYYIVKFDDESELNPINNHMEEYMEIISRLSSGLLRTGADMNFIVEQLERIGEKQTSVHSFAKGVARALKKYIPDGTEGGKCPECESEMVRQEGCRTCKSCGFTYCL